MVSRYELNAETQRYRPKIDGLAVGWTNRGTDQNKHFPLSLKAGGQKYEKKK